MDNQTVVRLLPVPLTEDEVAARAQELATAELYRCQVGDELEAEKGVWAERKKYLEARVVTASSACERLGKVVKERQEDRSTECKVIVRQGVYTLMRLDTGEAIVVRPATPGELQLELPVDLPVEEGRYETLLGEED